MAAGFPRRPVVLSLAVPVASLLLTGLVGGLVVNAWNQRAARATAEVTGQVNGITMASFEGDEKSGVTVVWTDETGERRFVEWDTPPDSPVTDGQPFTLRYDPAVTDPLEEVAVPTGDSARLVRGVGPPRWVFIPAGIFLAVIALYAVLWWRRARRAKAALAGESSTWTAVPLMEIAAAAFTPQNKTPVSVAVALLPPGAEVDPDARPGPEPVTLPPGSRWQRVVWSKAFASLRAGTQVTARIGGGARPGAVIELPGGERLWPAGRLGEKLPARYQRSAPHVSLRSANLPPRAYLLAPLLGLLFAPASLARAPALILLSPLLILLSYCMVFMIWAWRGALPSDMPNPR